MLAKTMSVRELSDFLGKSAKTIHRYAKECGAHTENGKETRLSEEEVKAITAKIFKRVPLAVQSSITSTFSNVQGSPFQNEKVQFPAGSVLTEKDIHLISAVVSMTVSETMKQFDERVTKIESRVEGRQALLPAPSMSPRDHINKLAREYANRHSIGFSEAYTTLYREFGYRTHSNPSIAAKNRGMAIIDYIESEGQIETLEAVAMEVFK